ncbi:MAG: hypothetical protein WDO73_26150 [Ignavibacteriota bacterium]
MQHRTGGAKEIEQLARGEISKGQFGPASLPFTRGRRISGWKCGRGLEEIGQFRRGDNLEAARSELNGAAWGLRADGLSRSNRTGGAEEIEQLARGETWNLLGVN